MVLRSSGVRVVCVYVSLTIRTGCCLLGGWVGVSCLYDIERLRIMFTMVADDYTLDVRARFACSFFVHDGGIGSDYFFSGLYGTSRCHYLAIFVNFA